MKKFLFMLSISLALFLNCKQAGENISDPSDEEKIRIIPQGNTISSDLLAALKIELKKAIAEGGFEEAAEVCSLKAIPITEIVEKAAAENIKIKRTTFKYRNPLNAPDDVEKKVLTYYQDLYDKDQILPDHYVQKVTTHDTVVFYFFKPLTIDHICLGCHGNPENMDTRTLNRLSLLYPEDKAVGYKEGDFRGLISVIIPE